MTVTAAATTGSPAVEQRTLYCWQPSCVGGHRRLFSLPKAGDWTGLDSPLPHTVGAQRASVRTGHGLLALLEVLVLLGAEVLDLRGRHATMIGRRKAVGHSKLVPGKQRLGLRGPTYAKLRYVNSTPHHGRPRETDRLKSNSERNDLLILGRKRRPP